MNDRARANVVERGDGHVRVLGPPGSGKSLLLVERFRWLESRGRHPAVITYGRARRERLADSLLPPGAARRGGVPVFTFPQLAREILEVTDPGRHGPLRDLQELVLLDRALSGSGGELRSDYARVSHSRAFRVVLLDVIHAILQHGVTVDEARRALADTGTRAGDILRACVSFMTLIDDRSLYTFYDAAWRAARLLTPDANPVRGCDILLVDDFGDVDPGQYALLRALAPPDGGVGVEAFGDPTGARFGYRGTSARFLTDVFPADYEPADVRLAPPTGTPLADVVDAIRDDAPAEPAPALGEVHRPEVGELQLGLFDTKEPSPPGDDEEALCIVGRPGFSFAFAEDETAECQYIAERIAAHVAERDFSPDDIGVIVRDPRRYERILTAALHDRGIPVDTGRRGRFAVDDFISLWFELLDGGSPDALAARLSTSPLYEALREHYAASLELPPRDVRRDDRDIRRIAGWIRKNVMAGGFSMERFIDTVIRPVVDNGDLGVAQSEAVSHIFEEWGRYADTAARLGHKPLLGEFRRWYGGDARRSPHTRGSVRLLSALEAASLSFRCAFVAGCAEGVFPAVERGPGYVPFADLRDALSSATSRPVRFHAARDRERKLRDEHALLATALSRATELLHVTAPREVDGEEVAAPSLLLQRWFTDAPLETRREGLAIRAARLLADAPAGDPPPAGAGAVERMWKDPPPEQPGFVVPSFRMSPSRVGTYTRCARLLFYDRILGIDDEDSIPLTMGRLFHDLMHRIGERFPTRSEVEDGLTESEIGRLVEDVCGGEEKLGESGSLLAVAARHHLAAFARRFRRLERRREEGYRVVRTEARADYEVEGLLFGGRIDRIDEANGRMVVVDYKTAREFRKRGDTVRKYALGESGDDRLWQIPLYAEAVRIETGRWPDLFCYYVFPPEEEAFAVGLFISDDEHRNREPGYFEASVQKRFASISPDTVAGLVKEAAGLTADVFSRRDSFARTEIVKHCKGCFFDRLCMRREQ